MAKPVSTSAHKKKWRIRDEMVFDTIMQMVQENPEKHIRPEDIAMTLRKEQWQELLKRVRLFVRKLALEGHVHIMRKGAVADPDDFKGIYRVMAGPNAAQYVPQMPEDA